MLLKGNIVFGSSSGLELMKNGDREGLIPNGQLATAAYEMLDNLIWEVMDRGDVDL